jgi:hypothetical protein
MALAMALVPALVMVPAPALVMGSMANTTIRSRLRLLIRPSR